MTARGFLCLLTGLSLLFLSAALGLHAFFLPGALLLCLFGTGLLGVLSARLTLRAAQRFPAAETDRCEAVPLILSLTLHALLPVAQAEAELIPPDGKPLWYMIRGSHWGTTDVAFPCCFPHVGRYGARISRLVLSDAAGFFRLRVRLPKTSPSLLVLPRAGAEGEDALPGGSRRGGPADPERDEPDHLRGFLPGDSLRRVHWKLSARRGELLVRTPERKRDADLIVALAAGKVSTDAYDALSEACCAFLSSAVARGGRLRLLLPGGAALDLPAVRKEDLPLLRRLLSEAADKPCAPLSEMLSGASLSVRLPDAAAVFAPHPTPKNTDLLLRLLSDGVAVLLTVLSGDAGEDRDALLEKLRSRGVYVRSLSAEGGAS